ncbi:MAG: hypothetical protein K9K67_10655 [Bacteriovoracaceae bacterium]|nr:hypothetical protein [Bacteriovoracaceae bacterium]
MFNLKKFISASILSLCLYSAPLFADTQVISFLLNEINRSYDANVQRELVRTLKTYNQDQSVQQELINQLQNQFNFQQVRVEAARSLSNLTADTFITNAITRAHDQSTDIAFRAEMLKCLYLRAPIDLRVRNVLVQNIKQNHDRRIKEASAFALMNTLDDVGVRQELINLSQNQFLDTFIRIALVKTLYNGIKYPEVRSVIEGIALSNNQDLDLRGAATRVLSTFPKGRQNRSALFNLVANSQYPGLRSRAAAGLKFEMTEDDVRWLSLPVDPRSGLTRDPFQN